ncbi:hypothetical protein RA28_17825 [Ruegeria sp. ANG-S4]|nr:hypothetical protein RA28_17825 [Ruegeria sp. ANG-S4]
MTIGLPMLAAAQSMDADGDGVLTLEEVQAVAPTVDSETFTVMDTNGDGTLDQDEVQVAQDAGVLPPSNG